MIQTETTPNPDSLKFLSENTNFSYRNRGVSKKRKIKLNSFY